ncbi:MAG: YcbK family protein [Reyranellaceae bacterium]
MKPPGKAAAAKPPVAARKPAVKPVVRVRVVRGPQHAAAVKARTAAKPVAATKVAAGRPAYAAVRTNTQRTGRYGGAVPAAAMMSPYAPPAEKLAPPPDDGSARTISLFNVNTRESITATYRRGGQYVPGELQKLSTFLVDHKSGDVIAMDPELFDILWHLQRSLGASSFEVLSAYRSPQTNAVMARMSRGVARNSLHTQGQAIDIKVPGFSPYQVRQAARALQRGGVGYYPRTGFVHVDTGPVRYW